MIMRSISKSDLEEKIQAAEIKAIARLDKEHRILTENILDAKKNYYKKFMYLKSTVSEFNEDTFQAISTTLNINAFNTTVQELQDKFEARKARLDLFFSRVKEVKLHLTDKAPEDLVAVKYDLLHWMNNIMLDIYD